MLIRSLTVGDFGLYRGQVTFDLVPRTKYGRTRPIVLFGGKNGAGKSTFLEALRLCLYGRASLGDRVRATDYLAYLADRIHRAPQVGYTPQSAQVGVEFEHVDVGIRHRYSVVRRWQKHEDSTRPVIESLKVLRDGIPLGEIDDDHWDDFVKDLVPPGLTDLFFFDGEKIQRLAEAAPGAELADSVRSLLGLNLVERLQADLDIYLARELRLEGNAVANERVDAIARDIENNQRLLDELEQPCAKLKQELEYYTGQAENLRRELTAKGGTFAAGRSRLEQEAAELTAAIQLAEDRVRGMAGGLLPFTLCVALCEQLGAALRASADTTLTASTCALLMKSVRGVLDSFARGEIANAEPVPPSTRKLVTKELIRAIEAQLKGQEQGTGTHTTSPALASLSTADTQQLLSVVEQARQLKSGLPDLTRALEQKLRRLQSVQVQLRQVPEEDVVGPLVGRLADAESQRGMKTEAIRQLNEQKAVLDRARTLLIRQRDKLETDTTGRKARDNRLRHVQAIKQALFAYHTRLTEAKISRLQDEAVDCFRRLCRKADLVRSIVIDPQTFNVTLRSANGAPIPKEELSAGEKQIFAISLLWALARTSGRALPIVIDTPLARLDKDHRRALFERYFPHVSHQVIVLSTDSEFDEQAFDLLRPNISHAYHLMYDEGTRATRVEEGYFWREHDHAPAEATTNSLLG